MRRKVLVAPKAEGLDEKKLANGIKKFDVQPIPTVEEVNMVKDDQTIMQFSNPRGESGRGDRRGRRVAAESGESVPICGVSVLTPPPPFPPPSTSTLSVQANFDTNTYIISGSSETRKISDLLSRQMAQQARQGGAPRGNPAAAAEEEDDEMPELEQDFEATSIKK